MMNEYNTRRRRNNSNNNNNNSNNNDDINKLQLFEMKRSSGIGKENEIEEKEEIIVDDFNIDREFPVRPDYNMYRFLHFNIKLPLRKLTLLEPGKVTKLETCCLIGPRGIRDYTMLLQPSSSILQNKSCIFHCQNPQYIYSHFSGRICIEFTNFENYNISLNPGTIIAELFLIPFERK